MKLFSTNNSKGFTIIETLVAIAIIMTAIAGPMTIAQRGLNAAVVARDQFVAQYLAQDAIEQFYYFRDLNIKTANPAGWFASVPSGNSGCTANFCRIDSFNNSFEAMPPGQIATQSVLYKTPLGFFTHQSGGGAVETQFKRTVLLRNINANEVAVVVKVTWQNGRITNEVELTKNVFNQ